MYSLFSPLGVIKPHFSCSVQKLLRNLLKNRHIYLQRHLPWPGVGPGLVPRHDPLRHVGLEVSRATVGGPVWDRKDTRRTIKAAARLGAKSQCVEVCVCVRPLTQVEELVLRLSSGRERVCGCRRGCLAQQQQQQQGQRGERRRSGRGHRLTDLPASTQPALFIPAHTGAHRKHTQQFTSGTKSSEPTKAGRWIVLLELPVSTAAGEKGGFWGVPSAFSYVPHTVEVQRAPVGQRGGRPARKQHVMHV